MQYHSESLFVTTCRFTYFQHYFCDNPSGGAATTILVNHVAEIQVKWTKYVSLTTQCHVV